jgi:hypothetical protein
MVDLKDIKWAWLIVNPADKNCTKIIKKLKENNIKFEMKGLFSEDNKSHVSETTEISCILSGKNAKFGTKLKLPILVLDHSKTNDCMNIVILEGKDIIINALKLTPH